MKVQGWLLWLHPTMRRTTLRMTIAHGSASESSENRLTRVTHLQHWNRFRYTNQRLDHVPNEVHDHELAFPLFFQIIIVWYIDAYVYIYSIYMCQIHWFPAPMLIPANNRSWGCADFSTSLPCSCNQQQAPWSHDVWIPWCFPFQEFLQQIQTLTFGFSPKKSGGFDLRPFLFPATFEAQFEAIDEVVKACARWGSSGCRDQSGSNERSV